MKLIVICKDCRNEVIVKDTGNDRVELLQVKGSEFILSCNSCQKESQYHVNDIKAQERKSVGLIAFMILLLGTGLIWYLLKDYLLQPNNPYNVLAIAGVLIIPSIVYGIITKQERDRVSRFNRYKL